MNSKIVYEVWEHRTPKGLNLHLGTFGERAVAYAWLNHHALPNRHYLIIRQEQH